MSGSQLIQAFAFDDQVRVIAATTTELVAEAARIHDTWPVTTLAFGRLLTGALMLGMTHKDATRLTIQVQGRGPAGLLLARASADGTVYGTVQHPHTHVTRADDGGLDVAGAVGSTGLMHVVRDLGFGEPYVGVTPLVSGEIGEDLAHYLESSEQIESALGVGVYLDAGGVKGAGGFLVQMLGGVHESVVGEVIARIRGLSEWSRDVSDGMDVHTLLSRLVPDARILDERSVRWHCPHDREYYQRRLLDLGSESVADLFSDRDEVEVTCEFTRQRYVYTRGDLLS